MTNLMPCPFCGAPASFEEINCQSIDGIMWSVGCSNTEDCFGRQSFSKWNTKGEAARAWNTRTAVKYETIDKFIKRKLMLLVRQHYDGCIQTDIADHHAQGPTLDVALERLEVYLIGLERAAGGVSEP